MEAQAVITWSDSPLLTCPVKRVLNSKAARSGYAPRCDLLRNSSSAPDTITAFRLTSITDKANQRATFPTAKTKKRPQERRRWKGSLLKNVGPEGFEPPTNRL